MSTQLQLRRGNTAQTAVFTGAIGEVTVDTDQKTLTIHDGTTIGGNYIVTKTQLQSNVSILQSINTTQNTNITSVNQFAGGAYNTANSANGLAAGAFAAANSSAANITIIQGVDNTQNVRLNSIETINQNQNTTITAVNGFAQSAYDTANLKFNTSGGNINGSVTITANNNLTVTGNLYVLGNTTSFNTQTLEIVDPVILLASGNYTTDLLDIGFVGSYNNGANAHTGLFRDATSTKEWYFFEGYTPEVSGNNNIVITNPTFRTSNVNVNYVKGNVIATTISLTQVDSTSNTFLTSSTAQVSVDAWPTSLYRSAKYFVQVSSGANFHIIELNLVHNGTTVFLAQYGEVLTSSSLGTFDADISGSTVRLLFTGVNAVSTVKVLRTVVDV